MHGHEPFYRDSGSGDHELNIPTGILRVAGVFSVSLWLASLLPPALVAPVLSQLLLFSAILAFVLAALTGDDIWAPKFTRWDETAVLLALAMLSGMLVDHEAARTAAENLSVELVGTGDDVLRSPQVSMDPA